MDFKSMDSKAFASFIKIKLKENVKQYEENLLSVNYSTIEEAKRISGIRDAHVGIHDSIDSLLKEYENQGNYRFKEDKKI
jgi:hypothetical protein